MTRDEVLNSIALKKRFCKDCNIPMSVYDNPYFMQRLEILNPLYQCELAFEFFCLELEKFANEQEYFEFYNEIKDRVIADIRNQPEYNTFVNTICKCNPLYPKKNLYSDVNDGKWFVSLDMKKANFSVLRYWSKTIFNNCETWEDFMRQYTDSSHIIGSKYIRQVILGACNPGKQIKYEHFLMNDLLGIMLQHLNDNYEVYSLGEDEIILSLNKKDNFYDVYDEIHQIISKSEISDFIRISVFKLEKIRGIDGWLKRIYNNNGDFNKVDFKCVSSEIFHQVVKYYTFQEIEDSDLVFYHNGKLAKFLEPIENPWK